MTRFDDLDRALTAWFEGEAIAPAPSALLERVAAATARRRPRPTWIARPRMAWAGFADGLRDVGIAFGLSRVTRVVLLAALLVGLLAVLALVGAQRGPDRFLATGPMAEPRSDATAVTLADGRVLIVGGWTDDGTVRDGAIGGTLPQATIEIWDPATGTSQQAGTMGQPRSGGTATLLRDGRVLIAGGVAGIPYLNIDADRGTESGLGTAAAEIYDPATGALTPIASMTEARAWHSATLLRDGRVLIVGGGTALEDAPRNADGQVLQARERTLATAEIYDPASGTFSPVGGLTDARQAQAAIRLDDGSVLIAGGRTVWEFPDHTEYRIVSSVELFDPATGLFRQIPAPGAYRGAARLPDGRVLLVGVALNEAMSPRWDVFDPRSGTFTQVDGGGRGGDNAVALPDGRVLVTNRYSYSGPPDTDTILRLSVYDPATGLVADAAPTSFSTSGSVMVGLPGGDVLLAGGDKGVSKSSDETVVFQPGRSLFGSWLP